MPTILITGANRGLGFEFVRQYRAQGERVLATIRDPAGADPLRKLGAEVHMLDMRDGAAILKFGEQLGDVAIDILIANAGIYEGRDAALDTISEETWIESFRVNTIGPMLLARALRGHVRRGTQRKLIAISSRFGSISANDIGGHYAYRASKAALNMAWHALSIDEPDLICVAMRPGWVRTRMGRPEAPLSVEESVTGMRGVIARLTQADSGKFLGYDGNELGW